MSDDEVMDEGELEGEIIPDPDLEGDALDEDALELDIEDEDLLVDPEIADSVEEEDPDAILREKLTAAEEAPPEEEEEDLVLDDKTDGMERLQPRRPDETQCTQCFLLVRNSAPGCPVEDDACPLFH